MERCDFLKVPSRQDVLGKSPAKQEGKGPTRQESQGRLSSKNETFGSRQDLHGKASTKQEGKGPTRQESQGKLPSKIDMFGKGNAKQDILGKQPDVKILFLGARSVGKTGNTSRILLKYLE